MYSERRHSIHLLATLFKTMKIRSNQYTVENIWLWNIGISLSMNKSVLKIFLFVFDENKNNIFHNKYFFLVN